MNRPLYLFALCFIVLWLSEQLGAVLRKTRAKPGEPERKDLEIILGAVLTLFALVVGFSFSMATGRYDLRKNLEAGEAVAIGTEYLRAGFLPATDVAHTRTRCQRKHDALIAAASSRHCRGT
jgi:hypothetical protein